MPLALRLAVAAVILLAFAIQMVGGLNPDVSWLLTVGERMLSGQHLYIDIYELNPPMSALLYLPFVALAQIVGAPAEPIVVAAVLLLAVLALAIGTDILRRGGLVSNTGIWWLIASTALTILPGQNFGEREHIAVILLLPLLAVSALRSTGQTPAFAHMVIAGLAAGLVMTIKPHFALPILLIALYSAFRAQSWRAIFNPEHVLAGLVLIAYWLAVWVWFPSFFSTMLPLASTAYLADRASLVSLVFGLPLVPIWLLLAGLVLLYRREMVSGSNGQYVAAALGFFLAYLVQGKGFVYHLLPTQLLLGLVFAQCFVDRNAQGRGKAIPIALAVCLLAAPGIHAIQGNSLRNEALEVLAPLGPGLKIANLTSQLEIASPLHRDLGGTLVNSGPCLWITLGAVRQRIATTDPAVVQEMAALETYERSRLRDDMLANPPDIILAGGDQFDWIGWASQDPEIAVMLSGYALLAQVGPETGPLQILRRKAL